VDFVDWSGKQTSLQTADLVLTPLILTQPEDVAMQLPAALSEQKWIRGGVGRSGSEELGLRRSAHETLTEE
jgi:hypothetical protein